MSALGLYQRAHAVGWALCWSIGLSCAVVGMAGTVIPFPGVGWGLRGGVEIEPVLGAMFSPICMMTYGEEVSRMERLYSPPLLFRLWSTLLVALPVLLLWVAGGRLGVSSAHRASFVWSAFLLAGVAVAVRAYYSPVAATALTTSYLLVAGVVGTETSVWAPIRWRASFADVVGAACVLGAVTAAGHCRWHCGRRGLEAGPAAVPDLGRDTDCDNP